MSYLALRVCCYASDVRVLRMRGQYDLAASVEWTLRQMVAELFRS